MVKLKLIYHQYEADKESSFQPSFSPPAPVPIRQLQSVSAKDTIQPETHQHNRVIQKWQAKQRVFASNSCPTKPFRPAQLHAKVSLSIKSEIPPSPAQPSSLSTHHSRRRARQLVEAEPITCVT